MKKIICILAALALVLAMAACPKEAPAETTGATTEATTETTPETVLASADYMARLSELSGLPIFATTAECAVANALAGQIENIIPLQLQEKYFDLPSQKPGNRPLWG